jgi:hypothetical protein
LRRVYASELAATRAFREFLEWLSTREEVFLAAYARGAERAGLPPLSPGELPFWKLSEGIRAPAASWQEIQLPRALTLTFFIRVAVCDFFLHGVGGAGYEPGVDLLFREVVKLEPPPWGWLTGTFFLSEPPGAYLQGRGYPFFLHDLEEVQAGLSGPLSAL